MASPQKITELAARAYLSRFCLIDPEQRSTVASVCAGADCYSLATPTGVVVFAVRPQRSRLWVDVAAGKTRSPICPALSAALDGIARGHGIKKIGFQTARRGLRARSERLGYSCTAYVGTGYVMEKTLS